jgi:uncharacterized protein (DUF2267 family)
MSTALSDFDSTLQTTHDWIDELKELLDCPDDDHRAYLVLRAVLHALRDRLPVDDAAALGAHLPMLIRGFYYEGWQPHGKPTRERKKARFLARIRANFLPAADLDAEQAARTVFQFLERHIPAAEIETMTRSLPPEIRSLFPQRQEIGTPATSSAESGLNIPSVERALPFAPLRAATGLPEEGSGQGRVDLTGTMPEGIRVDPDITKGHPGYEESGDSQIIPAERLSGKESAKKSEPHGRPHH